MADIDIDKCKITHYPAKVLADESKPIEKIDDDIRRLVEKMTDLMLEHKGVGLAGPQAGVDLRIFIISLDATRENVKVYINPTVTTSGQTDLMEEGCLSVPGIYTKVKRFSQCTVTATDLDGNEFTEEAEGLYARALQHENDHINGKTIVNRMSSVARIAHRRQIKRLEENERA
ncbi:peptide deformylase [Planctomycetota bacterium]